MPSWVDHAIWWHVYPLGFVGAPIRDHGEEGVVHRIGRLEAWWDHVTDLGADGVILGPIFTSTSHGYDTLDHFAIDPRLGDEEDFDHLVSTARARGIRVVLDGVFNHIGADHPAATSLTDGGVFEGHSTLLELDHASPVVEDLVVEVMTHWLARGIDGWRLDAAYSVPASFWARVLPRVRERYPDAWFLGEVIHGDYASIVTASTMDSVTQYELWQGIWHSLVDRNFFELRHAISRHVELLTTFVPCTFVGNHDVTRIATAVGGDLVPHALAVQFVVAGIPSLYAGDEFGFAGVKEERIGGDDAIRPEFPPDPRSIPDDGRGTTDLVRALVAMRRRNSWLTRAHTEVRELSNESVALLSADTAGSVAALLSVADHETFFTTGSGLTLVAGDGVPLADGWRLPPRGWAVLEG